MKKIVIASLNPVKVNASLSTFQKAFSEEVFEAEGLSIPSGVSDQPMSEEETLTGAINRAKGAQETASEGDYFVGIEGGIQATPQGMSAFAWVYILDRHGRSSQARTANFYLPPKVTELIYQGVELGHANDKVFGELNSKQKGGAVGSLTAGILGRTEYYEQAVLLALIPFINPQLYF
ncbi:inosine/xanthosine triphosphatase [Algivirga pacifica]|uniref:Probable inosine/xanthosine triphosphatase n=1 Tax=Algivirga pacifica TaxID=1162670 RepID=A0ABP9D8D6_9BACT